jgi:hypothetical protein
MHGMCRLLLVASLAVSVGAYNLRILHVNDHHSHVESDNYDANTDTQELLGCDMVKQVKFKYGGYSRVNQLLANLEKGTSDIAAPATAGNVLKLHAGDALTGTLWYTLFKGVADAEVMGKACFHAMGLGNHEFDDGDQNLPWREYQGCGGQRRSWRILAPEEPLDQIDDIHDRRRKGKLPKDAPADPVPFRVAPPQKIIGVLLPPGACMFLSAPLFAPFLCPALI